jgi:hypothetical protein
MPRVTIPGVGVVNFPYSMSADEISAASKRLYDEAQGNEAPLTRERRAPGAPSAMDAGHHPDSLARERFGKRIPGMQELLAEPDVLPTDAAFLKRAPEVGAAAGMALGGPFGAGVGAAGGSLIKGQFDRGMHVPTGGDVGDAALQGGKNLVLGGAGRTLARGAGVVGPALTKHAPAISKGASAIAGLGSGIASGSPMTGFGVGAATRMLTDPRVVRGAGQLATRVGAVPAHAVNKIGFGAISAEAFRQALLDALEAEPSASTVP